MKNIIIILFITILAGSCELLDVKPQQSIDADMAINNKADLVRAINGCYDAFQAVGYYGRNYIIVNDLAADNLIWSGTTVDYKQFEDNALTANNSIVDGIWADLYTAVNRINIVYGKIDGVEGLTEDEKTQYQGELLFLRGLTYFNLVRMFGGVPLRTQAVAGPGDVHLARSSVAEAFTLIISDLRWAEQWLSSTIKTPVKAHKTAASALLAKVYLFRYPHSNLTSDLDSAVYFSTEVIQSGLYQLDDFEKLFPANRSPESIFEIDFNLQDFNRLAQYLLPNSLGGRKEVAPAEDYESLFEAGDVRKAVTIRTASDGKYCGKYLDVAGGSDNVYVLRLAEMYLIRAEANNMLHLGASVVLPDIHTVRFRAGLTTPLNITTQNQLALAIEQERRLEFAFEGHRWPDIVRTNRAMQIKPSVLNINQYLFPIPLSEMLTNNLIGSQNPGY
jgi:starch-binding outer membrane protein, SusD/RagB family